MKKDFGDFLIEVFDRLIDKASGVLSELNESRHANDLYISAPAILIKYFLEAIEIKFLIRQYEKEPKYRNIRLIPSMDWAITFFYKDYVLYKEDWMIHKISLVPPVNTKKGEPDEYSYNAFLIKIQDLFYNTKPIDPLNN